MIDGVLDKFRQSKFAPVGTLDLGPHCGPKSSVNRVNVMSALPPEADIRLILVKGSANDPKRTLVTRYRFAMELLYSGHLQY